MRCFGSGSAPAVFRNSASNGVDSFSISNEPTTSSFSFDLVDANLKLDIHALLGRPYTDCPLVEPQSALSPCVWFLAFEHKSKRNSVIPFVENDNFKLFDDCTWISESEHHVLPSFVLFRDISAIL
jgi:hypothetical protein